MVGSRPYQANRVGAGRRPLLSLLVVVACVAVFALDALHVEWPLGVYMVPCSASMLSAGAWQTMFSSMFMHGSLMHLANNMLSLLWVGSAYEKLLGHVRFLLAYVASGVAGCMWYCHCQEVAGTDVPVVGASGAIFGLFGAYAIFLVSMLWRSDAMSGEHYMASRQLSLLLRVVLWNLVYGIFAQGVANEAHIGGLVCGVACGLVFAFVDAIRGNGRTKSARSGNVAR